MDSIRNQTIADFRLLVTPVRYLVWFSESLLSPSTLRKNGRQLLGLKEVKWGDEYVMTVDNPAGKENDDHNASLIKTKQTILSDFLLFSLSMIKCENNQDIVEESMWLIQFNQYLLMFICKKQICSRNHHSSTNISCIEELEIRSHGSNANCLPIVFFIFVRKTIC